MLTGIADTHTAIWYLFSDPRLGSAASEWIETTIPDLPDRIIAATAQFYGVPVLSRDGRIRASAIRTIW